MAESDDWKKRLADEYVELAARIARLNNGIEQLSYNITMERLSRLGESAYESDDDESVRSRQIELMRVQGGIMVAYLHILEERGKLAGIKFSPITRV